MPLIALLRKLFKTLNSDGTPAQIAAGIALGAALGLTPVANLHNLVIITVAVLTRVSMPGFLLGWALFVPLGFLLDPVFHALGRSLLIGPGALEATWTAMYNTPVLALTNFNNTVVLGSFLVWVAAAVPLYFLCRLGVAKYREHIYERLERTRFFKALKASKLYKYYTLLRPELD